MKGHGKVGLDLHGVVEVILDTIGHPLDGIGDGISEPFRFG